MHRIFKYQTRRLTFGFKNQDYFSIHKKIFFLVTDINTFISFWIYFVSGQELKKNDFHKYQKSMQFLPPLFLLLNWGQREPENKLNEHLTLFT